MRRRDRDSIFYVKLITMRYFRNVILFDIKVESLLRQSLEWRRQRDEANEVVSDLNLNKASRFKLGYTD